MSKYGYIEHVVGESSSSEKPEANKTTLLTIYKERLTITKKIIPKWFEFWKKEKEVEELEPPQILCNYLFPNRSFHIEGYDDNNLTFEIKNMKFDFDFSQPEYKGCTIMLDVTNDPYIYNAGQTVSLGYHVLRFTLEDVEILDTNKYKVHVTGIKHKIGLPQH